MQEQTIKQLKQAIIDSGNRIIALDREIAANDVAIKKLQQDKSLDKSIQDTANSIYCHMLPHPQ